MLSGLDMLMFLISIVIMLIGLRSRSLLWKSGQVENMTGSIKRLTAYLLRHKKILRRPWAGLSHFVIFLGVVVPFILVIAGQFGFSLNIKVSLFLSLLTDILGAGMFAGGIFFFARWMKKDHKDRPRRVLLPLIIIFIIVISGFFAEGVRLNIIRNNNAWASPFGWLLSFIMPDSALTMQLMIRIHFVSVLLFIAVFPYTFMRHIAADAVNVYYHDTEKRWIPRDFSFNGLSEKDSLISGMTWKQLLETEACVSCGRCEERCPAAITGKILSPKKVMHKLQFSMEKTTKEFFGDILSDEEVWACTTCYACIEHCPVFASPLDKLLEGRRHIAAVKGRLPSEARPMMRNIELFGDPLGKGPARRQEWAIGMDINSQSKQADDKLLLWIGCSGAFHPRYGDVVRSMVKILQRCGVEYFLLGQEENCCGDPARKLGNEKLFRELAEKNICVFKKYGITRIVALCPHCLQTLKNEYNALGYQVNVIHGTELLVRLIGEKKMELKYPLTKKVSIHDPCYLGRMNNIYDPLREVAKACPNVEIFEPARNRDEAFCCGGGGGRMWLHEGNGRKINLVRSKELIDSGAEIIGTSCPYCMTMIEDGVKSLEMENEPKIVDLIELAESCME